MNFTCFSNDLKEKIAVVSRAAAPKSTNPALEGIKIEAEGDRICFTGYDMKQGIYSSIPGDVKEAGNIVVNAKLLSSVVRSLPDGMVNFALDGEAIKVTCSKYESRLVKIDAFDYPALPEVKKGTGIKLPSDVLSQMIRQTVFAVSDNETRPVYMGELFSISEGKLTMVAIDGFRLAVRKEPVSYSEDISFIVPGTALSEIEKICSYSEDVEIDISDRHILFTVGSFVLITRRIDGDFLDYRKTLPQSFAIKWVADKSEFLSAVERVSILIDDKAKAPLRCTFSEGLLYLSGLSGSGKADDVCTIDGNFPDLTVGFNSSYLIDILKVIPTDKIQICMNTAVSPCVITSASDDDSFVYMLLPVRLGKQ